jgi:hypothetical protein
VNSVRRATSASAVALVSFLLDFIKVILTEIASVQLPSPTIPAPETLYLEHERPSARPPLLRQREK